MQGFERTIGITAPFNAAAFGHGPKSGDLIHILDPLSKIECATLGEIIADVGCWVRVAPRVGMTFTDLTWLRNLVGCTKLWLDITPKCALTQETISGLSKDIRSLTLPYRAGAFYLRVAFAQLAQLESLVVSGKLTDLVFLRDLVNLKELTLFRAQLKNVNGAARFHSLTSLSVERSKLQSAAGLEGIPKLVTLLVFDSTIEDAEGIGKCSGLERLEIVSTKLGGASSIPRSNMKYLRLVSVRPPFSLESVWEIPQLEFLSHDGGASELEGSFRPSRHPTLKKAYFGAVDRQKARLLSKLSHVKVVNEEHGMPFTFGC